MFVLDSSLLASKMVYVVDSSSKKHRGNYRNVKKKTCQLFNFFRCDDAHTCNTFNEFLTYGCKPTGTYNDSYISYPPFVTSVSRIF